MGNAISTSPINGQVFNIDVPGVTYPNGLPNNIVRQRVNFVAYVVGSDGRTVISPAVLYNIRVSCKNPQSVPFLSNDVSGDNAFGLGSTPITWDLQ